MKYLGPGSKRGIRTRSVPATADITELTDLEEGEMLHPEYRKLLGKIGWLAGMTRPDISFAFSYLSRFNSKGGDRHFQKLLDTVKYLAATPNYGLTFRRESTHTIETLIEETSDLEVGAVQDGTMVTFSDITHGGEKPMAGWIKTCNGQVFDWAAYRCPTTPTSVTAGEYIAATIACESSLASSGALQFLGFTATEQHPIIMCDNLAVVKLSDRDFSAKRLRHMMAKIAFLQEAVEDKKVSLYHVRTTGQLADIFTKPLLASTFHMLRAYMVT